MRLRSTVVSLFALGLFFAPHAHAKECKPFKQGMKFTFKFDGTLQELSEMVSKTTCKKIEIPAKLRGVRLKFDPAEPMTPEKLWDFFVRTLQAYDIPLATIAPKETKPSKADWDARIAKGIKKVSEGRYEIDKALAESFFVTSDMALKQVRVIPVIENSGFNGIKLFSIRPNSFYAKVGLKNGDIVRRIQDVKIESIQTLLNLYEQLKTHRSISLEIDRKTKRKVLKYKLVGS